MAKKKPNDFGIDERPENIKGYAMIDNADVIIMKELRDLKPEETLSMYGIAKRIFNNKNSDNIRKNAINVTNRLQKLYENGLVNLNVNNKKKECSINDDVCCFRKGVLTISDNGDDVVISKGEFFVFNISGKFYSYQL